MVAEQLRELSRLERNWNSYGADPIAASAISHAANLIAVMAERGSTEPWVVPLPDGGVQVEWQGGAGRLDVEVAPDGALAYLLMHTVHGEERFEERHAVATNDVLQAAWRGFLVR